MRAADGSSELPIPSYELFTSTEILGKVTTNRDTFRACSPVASRSSLSRSVSGIAETSSAAGKSAVSRKFVAVTATALADQLLAAVLPALDLVALMIDGKGSLRRVVCCRPGH